MATYQYVARKHGVKMWTKGKMIRDIWIKEILFRFVWWPILIYVYRRPFQTLLAFNTDCGTSTHLTSILRERMKGLQKNVTIQHFRHKIVAVSKCWSALRKLLLSSPGFHPMFLNIFGSHKPWIHVMFCRQERMKSDLCRFCFGWAVIHNLYWKAGSWRLSFCSNLLPINSQTNEDIYESILSGECGNMWNLPWKNTDLNPTIKSKYFLANLGRWYRYMR